MKIDIDYFNNIESIINDTNFDNFIEKKIKNFVKNSIIKIIIYENVIDIKIQKSLKIDYNLKNKNLLIENELYYFFESSCAYVFVK